MGRACRGLTASVLAILALVASAGSGVAAQAERVLVQQVPGAEQQLYYRPHVFYLSADGALTLTAVKWRSYGGATATATAVAHTNNCLPACIGGTFTTHRTKLRLTGRKYCGARDREIYARLSFHILGEIPHNFGNGRGSISMRPVDIGGDPLC
jgi:hypothetical protein